MCRDVTLKESAGLPTPPIYIDVTEPWHLRTSLPTRYDA